MRQIGRGTWAWIRAPLAATAMMFMIVPGAHAIDPFASPTGKFRIEVTTGKNAKGSDVMPVTAHLTSKATSAVTNVSFQLSRYSQPTDRTIHEAFRWAPDDSAVAIENHPEGTDYGFRLLPLKPGLPWKARDIVAIDLQWLDEDRLVYRGDAGEEGYFIGVFDGRTGKARTVRSKLSHYTSYEVTEITPDSVSFREATRGEGADSCYRFNTNTGKRTNLTCPR